MNNAAPQIVLNPVMLLIDDGCPHYQGLDDLPILMPDGTGPSTAGDDVDDGAAKGEE